MPIPSFDNCYWVEPGRFLAGEYPGHKEPAVAAARVAALAAAGVGAFIDLTGPDDGLEPYAHLLDAPVLHQRFTIRDVSIPHSDRFTGSILDAIDAHLAAGRLVYVHCWGGVGRTGVVVGCWLARHGQPGQPALDHLHELWRACPKSAWRESPETREQVGYILKWKEYPSHDAAG